MGYSFGDLYKSCDTEYDKYIFLFNLYLSIIDKSGVIEALHNNIEPIQKEKIFTALNDISKSILDGFNNQDLREMEEAALKLELLYKYIEILDTNEETYDGRNFEKDG